ncbi:MAG TPA: hypothetical protein VE136_11980 [Anaerolineales bacterium]|nr:hypothetical protein [Anaerolineales bacterium]
MNAEKRGSFAVLSGTILGPAFRLRLRLAGAFPSLGQETSAIKEGTEDLGYRRVPAALNVPLNALQFRRLRSGRLKYER